MNVIGQNDHPVSPGTWEEPEMKRAAMARDISSIYRLLRKTGISQRQIAALTGQSQSEVSEILKGRQVMAYDVLTRIADGLSIPRGYMGLAYDEATATSAIGPPDDAQAEEDDSVKRRELLAHGASLLFSSTYVLGTERGEWRPSPAQTPAPGQIGMTDVRRVEATTRALRALDYQYGGGACRDAVVAQLSWGERMLSASATQPVRQRLFRALADLQNLAGWTTFDVGLLKPSRQHFARAMEFAKQAEDQALLSNIMYRIGRVHLHYEHANDALRWFQLGQIAAQNSGSELAVAVLCANEAWAFAEMGNEVQTMKMLGRSRDELARADLSQAPDWARFFDQNEMHAVSGSVQTVLGATLPQYAPPAIAELEQAGHGYTQSMARSRAFMLTSLATNHLRQGDVDHGVRVGGQALDLAEGLESKRVYDRLKPLRLEAAKRVNNADARDFTERLRQSRAV